MSTYNANTTGDEVAQDCQSRIAGKTILITGATPKGLGANFATTIAKHEPACIILATRTVAKAEETARDIAAVSPKVRTHSVALDLSSMAQVRKAAEVINALPEQIDVIVNNAGIMAQPYSKTVDGIESHFATNHIGHFLLTNLLLPKILARKTPVRVVNVSSNGYNLGPIRFRDLNFDDGSVYNPWVAYGQSKTANMLFSLSLAKKLGPQGLVSVGVHPGVINTNLADHLGQEDWAGFGITAKTQAFSSGAEDFKFKTPEQGVATHVFAAFHPSLESPEFNGKYLEDSHVLKPEEVRCWGRDPVEAERLWALSEELVSQKFAY